MNCAPYSIILGQTGQTFSPSGNAQFAVVVTQNGCIETSAFSLVMGMGLDDYNLERNFSILPNLCSEFITLEFGLATRDANVSILNALGQTFVTLKHLGQHKRVVEISSVTPGVYFVCLESNGQRVVKKLVKN